MSERVEQMKKLRLQGLTYEEIGKAMGVSKQRVYQLIGGDERCHFIKITQNECVYPNLRNWMNENKVTRARLTRLIYGINNFHPRYWSLVAKVLKGSDCHKHCIDKILKVTGLTYEVAFAKEGAESV